MYLPLFTVARLREAFGGIHHDKGIGHVILSGPDDEDSLERLVERWAGISRALLLAGYKPVQIFIEYQPASAAHRTVLDLGTLGYGVSSDFPEDGLDPVRETGPAMLIGLVVDPLWLFGEPGGAPLTLPTEVGPTPASGSIAVDRLAAIDGVFPVLNPAARGWLGFSYDEEGVNKVLGALNDQVLAVAGVIADAVRDAWARDPSPLGPPAGLGWVFDQRNWWFPARADSWPDADAGRLREALRIVCDELRPAGSDATDTVVEPFLTGQVGRLVDPFTFSEKGGFGHELRTRAGPEVVTAAAEAYRQRVETLSPIEAKVIDEVSTQLGDRYTFTDALLTFVEQGAMGIAHRLLPGLPSTALGHTPGASIPEWTTPQLTGQWDALEGTDTLILNQAGQRIAGFWQRRVSNRLDRYVLDGRQTGGLRTGGPLSFSASCWHQTAIYAWANLEGELGPPLDKEGQITVSQVPGEVPLLTLHVDTGTGKQAHEFQFSELGSTAHATEASMTGLSEVAKQRIRDLRDAPLHRAERYVPEFLTETAATYVARFLEEEPDWTALGKLLDEFKGEVEPEVGAFTAKKDLMRTVRAWVRTALSQRRGLGLQSCYDLLGLMFRMAYQWPSSVWLQQVYGLTPKTQSGGFRYQWRLTAVAMKGAALFVEGASGKGTFELRRVDAKGNPIGAAVARTIDLQTSGFVGNLMEVIELMEAEVGVPPTPQEYTGPGDFAEWSAFDPTNRDITAHLDGASFTLSTDGASFLGFQVPGAVDVELKPTDGLQSVTGQSMPRSLEFPLVGAIPDDATMQDVYDRFKGVKGLIDSIVGIGADLKKGKLPQPTLEATMTEGWIRTADGSSTRPSPAPVPVERYQDARPAWTRFDTNKYDLSAAFRDAIREALLWNLQPLTRLSQLTVNGYASQVGKPDYNVRLSRDRAFSVLTAVYDILGPELAVACGDVRIHAFGATKATGPPGSDEAYDRRAELVIAGHVQMRS